MASLAPPRPPLRVETLDEYFALVEQDEYKLSELVDGVVVVSAPSLLHQRVAGNILFAIIDWTRQTRHRGEVLHGMRVVIPSARLTVRLPDVAWWPEDRCAPPGAPPGLDGPPGLAIEVLSPSTALIDANRKRAEYALTGIDEYWLVHPVTLSAQVLRRPEPDAPDFMLAEQLGGDGSLSSPSLPGLAIPLADLTRR